jgi:hypothetical protein
MAWRSDLPGPAQGYLNRRHRGTASSGDSRDESDGMQVYWTFRHDLDHMPIAFAARTLAGELFDKATAFGELVPDTRSHDLDPVELERSLHFERTSRLYAAFDELEQAGALTYKQMAGGKLEVRFSVSLARPYEWRPRCSSSST